MYKWDTKIRYVRGLGPTRSQELTKIGIETVGDLLEYPPLFYIYPGVTPIADAKEGMVVVKGRIRQMDNSFGNSVEVLLYDKTGSCYARWYTKHVLQSLHPGMIATFYGKMEGGVLQQPCWTTVESSMENVCGGQYGVHHDTIRAALKEVLANVELPRMYEDWDRIEAFKRFHFPRDKADQQWATDALKFDEALTLQLALAEKWRGRDQGATRPIAHNERLDRDILSCFPYDFTNNQEGAINDIIDDLSSSIPMQRLIHGEVGSGKTAIAFYATMLAALNGKRTLVLCPTTILAQQHYDTLKGMGWDDVGLHNIKTFLHGDLPHIMIGTHSILYSDLPRSASLVIVDEFQKFGVKQRASLQQNHPHLLMLSATPIPRSLAATVFGDLDVSTIRQLPIKRGTVVTRWVLPDRREGMYEIIEKELAKGKQAYVIYPRISGDEDTASAILGAVEIRKRFPKYTTSLLTGKMTASVKGETLQWFRDGRTRIMVSTIIAEVGLDNPNATVMVIEGADRFGLSQLHQLRGRVCRSTDTAFCFLVSETANPTSIARLEVIEKCNDGFEIAEHDLRLRGSGEMFSTRQHGLPDLKFVSLVDDYDLMVEAKELVQAGPVGSGVREMMVLKYGDNLGLGEVI